MKIIGFKKGVAKNTGKHYAILHVTSKPTDRNILGLEVNQIWLYDALADKLPQDCLNKEFVPTYSVGYNGKAIVSDYTLA